MYVGAQRAMHRREMIESPSCAVQVMQQPDLGKLGRLTGPPIVTMGGLGDDTSSDSVLTTSGIFGIPWISIALIGGVLLGGVFLYKHFSGGGGAAPRRRRKFKLPQISLPQVALIGAVAYFYAKSQNS